LGNVLDELGRTEASGETGLPAALHEAAERVPQRALFVIISDLFVDPAELRGCFEHLRFRRHDVAVFHLLEQAEIEFQFDRPIRFVDLEGGTAILADPTIIARQYRRALESYFENLTEAVREASVDYHRVSLDEPYETVLARFLLARTPKRSK
jgi:hypothetical protein